MGATWSASNAVDPMSSDSPSAGTHCSDSPSASSLHDAEVSPENLRLDYVGGGLSYSSTPTDGISSPPVKISPPVGALDDDGGADDPTLYEPPPVWATTPVMPKQPKPRYTFFTIRSDPLKDLQRSRW